jgi:hypothetical protein
VVAAAVPAAGPLIIGQPQTTRDHNLARRRDGGGYQAFFTQNSVGHEKFFVKNISDGLRVKQSYAFLDETPGRT